MHLLINCIFARLVTHYVASWLSIAGTSTNEAHFPGVAAWLQAVVSAMETHQRSHTGALLYSWWNIWKERNRRIFLEQRELFCTSSIPGDR